MQETCEALHRPVLYTQLTMWVSMPFPGPTARAEWFLEVHPESAAAAGAPVSSVCVCVS